MHRDSRSVAGCEDVERTRSKMRVAAQVLFIQMRQLSGPASSFLMGQPANLRASLI